MALVHFFFLLLLPSFSSPLPNIVFILVDDIGWNDFSLHGSAQIPTPNIDSLAQEGVLLNQYYVNPVCSPTRASLMSGRSVIHHGIYNPYPVGIDVDGLNLTYTLLPQHLKQEYNYSTYMIGKWHLGTKNAQYQPTNRGFDRYFGYWAGGMDYWGHYNDATFGVKGLDLHSGDGSSTPESPVYNTTGDYSTFMFSRKAEEWIESHVQSLPTTPFFLYLAFQNGHTADNYIQAPSSYIQKFNSIDPTHTCGQYDTVLTGNCTATAARKSVAANVNALDDAVGDVVTALKRAGVWENTLLVFSSDNGGPVNGTESNMMSNFPLRGCKGSYYEGGIRATSFVHGAGLVKTGYVNNNGLFHISDWLPTLLTAVERASTGDLQAYRKVGVREGEPPFVAGDGIDNWDMISMGVPSQRTELIHATQAPGSVLNSYAIRVGDLKLVYGPGQTGCGTQYAGWIPPPGLSWNYTTFTVQCGPPPTIANSVLLSQCTKQAPCLFNISSDPCEYTNLANVMPDAVAQLQAKIDGYTATTILSWNNFATKYDPAANPKNFPSADPNYGGVWTPWLTDAEEVQYYPTYYTGPPYN